MMRLELPEDIKNFLRLVQADKKIEKKSGFYSMEQTICFCLHEYMELKGARQMDLSIDREANTQT